MSYHDIGDIFLPSRNKIGEYIKNLPKSSDFLKIHKYYIFFLLLME